MTTEQIEKLREFLSEHSHPRVILSDILEGQVELRITTPIQPQNGIDHIDYFLIPLKEEK